MKRARVYQRGPRLLFHAVSETTEGAFVIAPPFVKAEVDAAETFLGETLARTLEASRLGARDPGPAGRQAFLDLSRSKSWTSFMRDTLVCDVEKDRDGVRLFPARNATRRPFAVGDDETPAVVLPEKALPIELGAAILRALATVTPRGRAGKKPAESAPGAARARRKRRGKDRRGEGTRRRSTHGPQEGSPDNS